MKKEFCLLQSFLESIEYTCGITFKGLSELSSSKNREETNVDINEDEEKEIDIEQLLEKCKDDTKIAEYKDKIRNR